MSGRIEAKLERIEALLNELNVAVQRPFDVSAAASYMTQSKSYVYKLTSNGLITYYKPAGKKIYFMKKDLDAYIFRNRTAAADEIEAAAASYVVSRSARGGS
jgi:excisionase family DNA binding protein